MAVEDILKLKVRQSIKDLESLAKIISGSEENKSTYSDISQLVGEIINRLSLEFPQKEDVEDVCNKLIEVAQEYNDSGDNLDVKEAASLFAKRIAVIDESKYKDFIETLLREDEYGSLKYFVQIKSASIEIIDVKLGDSDRNGNPIRDFGSKLYTDVEYLIPQITYKVLQTGTPVDIWYKIYSPEGKLLSSDNSKLGFTWNGSVQCDTIATRTAILGGFGNTNKKYYEKFGIWRIEFYDGENCLYKTTFEIESKPTVESAPLSPPAPPSAGSGMDEPLQDEETPATNEPPTGTQNPFPNPPRPRPVQAIPTVTPWYKKWYTWVGAAILMAFLYFTFGKSDSNKNTGEPVKTEVNVLTAIGRLEGNYTLREKNAGVLVNGIRTAAIKKTSDTQARILVVTEYGPEMYEFTLNANGSVESEQLGKGEISYNEKLDKITLTFKQGERICELTK